MGGTSSERDVSLDSGRNVLEALRRRGVQAEPVDGIPALVDGARRRSAFDRVFNILHGQRGGGEDGVVQGLLEAFGVPYTGSDVLGSALSMDKIRTKQVWLAVGLPTPRYVRIGPATMSRRRPMARTAGRGQAGERRLERGRQPRENRRRAVGGGRAGRRYPGELLMEQLIDGDEYTVGVLGEEALPSIRIVPAGEYYDYHAKYVAETTQYLCPGLEGAGGSRDRRPRAAGVQRRRLPRLGPRGRDARSERPQFPARGQHLARA